MCPTINPTREANSKFFWHIIGPYCRRCGYNEHIPALQFHHLESESKKDNTDSLAYWLPMSRYKLVKKVSETKFTIYCANCHIELHTKLRYGDVRIKPIDTSVFKEMLKCMHIPTRVINEKKRKILQSSLDRNIKERKLLGIINKCDRVEKCRLNREESCGINCDLEECGFCGIEKLFNK